MIANWRLSKTFNLGGCVWINLFCVFGSLLVDPRVCKLLQHKEHIYEGMFNFPACFLNMTCFLSVYDEHWLTEYVGCLLIGLHWAQNNNKLTEKNSYLLLRRACHTWYQMNVQKEMISYKTNVQLQINLNLSMWSKKIWVDGVTLLKP